MKRRIYYDTVTGKLLMITDARRSAEEEKRLYNLGAYQTLGVLESQFSDDVVKNIQNYRINLATGKLERIISIPDPTPGGPGGPSDEQLTEIITQLNEKVDKVEGKGLFSGSYVDLTDKPAIPATITLNDTVTSTSKTAAATANAVKTAYDQALAAFQSASDGKNAIATAITGKGVAASGSDAFGVLATKIGSIAGGTGATKEASGSGSVFEATGGYRLTVTGLAFKPRMIFVWDGVDLSRIGYYFAVGTAGYTLFPDAKWRTSSATVVTTDTGFYFQSLFMESRVHRWVAIG